MTRDEFQRNKQFAWRYSRRYRRRLAMRGILSIVVRLLLLFVPICLLTLIFPNQAKDTWLEGFACLIGIGLFFAVLFTEFRRQKSLNKRCGLLCPHCGGFLYSKFNELNIKHGICKHCKSPIVEPLQAKV